MVNIGDEIRFKAISDLTGQRLELTGVIEGGPKEIKKMQPAEYGGLRDDEQVFLVVRQDSFGNTLRYVVHEDEILYEEGE